MRRITYDKQDKTMVLCLILFIVLFGIIIVWIFKSNTDKSISNIEVIETELKQTHDEKVEKIKNLSNDSILMLFNETF